MKRTFTRRDFTKMTAASAVAAGLARAHGQSAAAALLAQNTPPQVEEPGAVAAYAPAKAASNTPSDQWSGHDSPAVFQLSAASAAATSSDRPMTFPTSRTASFGR